MDWWIRWAIGAAVAILVLFGAPSVLPSYYVGLVTSAVVAGAFAVSLSTLVQWLGLPSLGHAAFFGGGAYAVAILGKTGWSAGGVGAAAGVGAVAGLLLAALSGPLALRAKGGYFLLATLALGQVFWGIAMKWISLTGGEHGLVVTGWAGVIGQSEGAYYQIVAAVLVAIILSWSLLASAFGRALVGIRENETRMAVLGWDVWRYKYAAFLLAGAGAGLAGGLHAVHNGFVSPAELSIGTSAEALFMVILGEALCVGRVRGFLGPVLGAALVVLLEHVISSYTERWQMVMGLAFLSVFVARSRGGRTRWGRQTQLW